MKNSLDDTTIFPGQNLKVLGETSVERNSTVIGQMKMSIVIKRNLVLHNYVNTYLLYFYVIITSAKEVIFSAGFVRGFVSLFVNKITQKLMDGF